MAKRIVVDLTDQSVTAYDGAKVFRTCECVTGDAAHPTPKSPTGKSFHINRKHHPYTSHTYGVQMDYAMFFTKTGEALHQYQGPAPWWMLRAGRWLTDAVGSHGCVRLQKDDAKALYAWAPMGISVIVR
jgi:lipoprotein-anchoring transpeptidase ErfK/SrfK